MTACAKRDEKVRRTRPEDGGMVWRERLSAFECFGCGDLLPQRRPVWTNPERMAVIRELLIIDHTECWEYDDPRLARLARRFRKNVKRQMNLAMHGQARMGR